MTQAKYKQLKKRLEWLTVVIAHCDGEYVSDAVLRDAVAKARHFRNDVLTKILRYKTAESVCENSLWR